MLRTTTSASAPSGGGGVAGLLEQAGQPLGVVHVHLAPVGAHAVGTRGCLSSPITGRARPTLGATGRTVSTAQGTSGPGPLPLRLRDRRPSPDAPGPLGRAGEASSIDGEPLVRMSGRQQVVRRTARAPGHRPGDRARRGRRRHRAVRLGQVDALPDDQPAGTDRLGRDRHRRRSCCPRRARQLARLRSDVGMVFQSFNLFAHKTVLENVTLGRSRSAGVEGRGREARPRLLDRVASRPGRQVPGPALRRPAAAGRDRPGPRHGPEGDALRRADVRARPRDDQRGPRRDDRRWPGTA